MKKKRLYAILGLILLACLLPLVLADEYSADHFSNVTLEVESDVYEADHFSNVTLSPVVPVPPGYPEVTLNHPTNNQVINIENITFNYTCTDNYNITNSTFCLGNGTCITTLFGTGNETTVTIDYYNVPEGSYTWNATCFDNDSQNTSSDNYNWIISYTNLTIILSEPEDSSTYTTSSVTFDCNVTSNDENNSIVDVSLIIDDTVNQTNSSGFEGNYTWTVLLGEGDYNWTCNATDRHGEVHTNTSYDFDVDLPSWADDNWTFYTYDIWINITQPLNGSYVSNESGVNLNWTYNNSLNPADTCIYWTSDGTITNTSIVGCGNTTFNINDGNYLLYLWVNDSYGNAQQNSTNFTVDTTFPQIAYGTGTTVNGSSNCNTIFVNVTYTEENFQNVTFGLYNSSTGAVINETTYASQVTEVTFDISVSDTYDFNVTVCDGAGNCNSTDTRTADAGPCYALDITLSDGIDAFIFNVSNMSGTFQPINQSETVGVLNVTNNESSTLDIIMKFNESSGLSNITVKANDEYNLTTAVTVNVTYITVIPNLASGDDNMIWLWAIYNDTRRPWFPEMDILGM